MGRCPNDYPNKLMVLFLTCIFSLFFHTKAKSVIEFESNSTFKIAIFADLHFGENSWSDWGPIQDLNSLQVMSNVLDNEKPDFVVYLGDVITANNIAISNGSLYWEMAISPTKARGIPWASVFGNHDDAPFSWPIDWFNSSGIPQLHCSGDEECDFKGTSRKKLMKKEVKKNILSHSRSGPKDLLPSISNYYLQVSSSDDPKSPVMFLYFLDSGGGSYPEVISTAQVDWFRGKSEELNPDSRVPEIVFWHIPSQAYKSAAPSFIEKPCVGSINYDKVDAQEAEFGMMELLVKRPSVKAVFVGHNHGLDWCCPYKKKLWLCFARHTGYGGYGNWSRGARILEITKHPFSLKSWIRMEDGHLHSEVILSS